MENKEPGLIIPHQKLSPDALNGLIEEFILREGTDYGTHERSLEDKKSHIFKQLNAKHILVVFDPNTETTSLLTKDQLNKLTL
mgnify:CR=1 FL=1